jgi:hypothetical protein
MLTVPFSLAISLMPLLGLEIALAVAINRLSPAPERWDTSLWNKTKVIGRGKEISCFVSDAIENRDCIQRGIGNEEARAVGRLRQGCGVGSGMFADEDWWGR